jgi:hypothetical protein
MATSDYPQIDEEEYRRATYGDRASKITHFNEPEQQPTSQIAVKPPKQRNESSVPNAVAPPSKGAQDIDLSGMVNQVTNATTQMQQDMPAPKPADSSQHIMDLVAKHWQIPAAVIGTLATGALLNKFMNGEKTSAPPPSRIDPLMDVSRQGPIEPSMEVEKPSIKSRSFAPTYSPEDQALLERSEANRIAKEQEAARRASAAAPPSEPPAFIRNQPPVAQTPVTNPKVPALLQASAGAVAPSSAAPVVAAPIASVVAYPVAETPIVTAPVTQAPAPETPTEAPKEKPAKAAKPSKAVQPPGTGGADNWLHSAAGPEIYADVIKRKNEGKPYGPGEAQQAKAYKDWREYQNEVGRMRPYTKTPVLNLQALEEQKFRSANIPGKIPLSAIPPPPTLRPTELGQGGSLLRSLTDPLQLKQ